MFRRLPPQFRAVLRGRKELFTTLGVIVVMLFLYSQRVPLSTAEHSVAQYIPFSINGSYSKPPQLINPSRTPPRSSTPFQPGTVDAPDRQYTKALVIARTKTEEISWLNDTLDGSNISVSEGWEVYTYTTDDLSAPHHTPLNKGREAMAYLTYIIDHYNPPSFPPVQQSNPESSLPEVILFLHAHRQSWHDNLFSLTTPSTITHLHLPRVIRLGYMNLRCSWDPGCPDHIHPHPAEFDPYKPEESVFASSWSQLFPPSHPVPAVLSQPCCAQFAVSRERILARPLAVYVGIRDWLLTTELVDALSGRVLEYIWQVLWTGRVVVCPGERGCYCDGYGICFGGGFGEWVGKRRELGVVRGRRDEVLGGEVEKWGEGVVMEVLGRVGSGDVGEVGDDEPGLGKDEGGYANRDPSSQPSLVKIQEILSLNQEVEDLEDWLERELAAARERGKDPAERAKEVEGPLLDIPALSGE